MTYIATEVCDNINILVPEIDYEEHYTRASREIAGIGVTKTFRKLLHSINNGYKHYFTIF